MKYNLLVLTLAFVSSAFGETANGLPAGQFQLDSMHSKVGFEVPHLVISTVEGRFDKYEGSITLGDSISKTKVSVTIDTASIDTGTAKRDEHLKSADFFDVKKYPKIKFESLSAEGTPEGFKLTGNLTIKDVTKKVVLESKYLGSVKDGFGNLKIAFEGKTKISRKEFGLKWNGLVEAGPAVGDEVTIILKVQAGHPISTK